MHFFNILPESKYETFSLSGKLQEASEVKYSLLKNQEVDAGTGYPTVQSFSSKFPSEDQKNIWIARDIGAFEYYNLETNEISEKVIFPFAEDRKIKAVFEHKDQILAVSDHGEVALWNTESEEAVITELKGLAVESVAKKDNILAVGGKGLKNNLQLWDLDKLTAPQVVAKQTQNTRLNMPYPVDVRGIAFSQNDRSDVVVTCNADGQLWLYDFKVKKTPIIDRQVQPKKTAIASVHATPRDDCVIYTTPDGVVEAYDMRTGRSLGRYGPHEGAITDLLITSGLPSGQGKLLITCCKDRFVRIFDYSTRAMLGKVYVKHVPNAVFLTGQSWLEMLAKEYADSEEEEFWEEMVEVPDQKKSKIETE